jgi:hypothetical protein
MTVQRCVTKLGAYYVTTYYKGDQVRSDEISEHKVLI